MKEKRLHFAYDFQGPLGFCVGPDKGFCIADEFEHALVGFDAVGERLFQYTGSDPEQTLSYPTDVAWNGDTFFVTDRYHHRVVEVDREGTFVNAFGAYGSDAGCFIEPYGISCDATGFLWVADSGNSRLQIFKPDGEFLDSVGCPGPGSEYYGSEFFKKQEVFKKWVGMQTRFHTLESSFFASHFTLGNLDEPRGVATREACCFVADFSGRLQSFNLQGELLASHTGCKWPEWIAVQGEELYLSCSGDDTIYTILKDGTCSPFYKAPREVGKIVCWEPKKLIYAAPWEKQFYELSW